jgi:MGT family glycosyltransferase
LEVSSPKPVIYISLGTVHNTNCDFYQTCFQALGGNPDYQVVLSVGKSTDITALQPIPANFIVRNYVPQLEILQRATLFVSHSGMNSVHEALYYGVPLLLIPQTFEQKIVTNQIVKNGAGVYLDKEGVSAANLRQGIEKMLREPTFRQNAGRLGAALQNAGGASRAADEIFQLKQRLAL